MNKPLPINKQVVTIASGDININALLYPVLWLIQKLNVSIVFTKSIDTEIWE